jgi:hypothetical protein
MGPPRVDPRRPASVDLYWLPLGAGTVVVRWSGRVYEAIVARWHRRGIADLYHSALVIGLGDERHVIEMAPVWGNGRRDRGVVGEGPVGARWLGRSRLFRYEVRRWRDGVIPDIAYAVASPLRLSGDARRARSALDLVPACPTVTWGRDELDAGEMWNSNSLIAWLLARSGHDLEQVHPPGRGRAPGWDAGLAVAAREVTTRPRVAS